MSRSPVIALVGCGAIAESTYLPALAAKPEWRGRTWLVEPNAARGAVLASRIGILAERVVQEIAALPEAVGFAINATPSHLHVSTTLALLDRDADVLIEKPFAENARDAVRLVEAAHGRSALSVNQSRRAGPSNALVRRLIKEGRIGAVRRIRWSEGHKFDWPSQSGFNFRRPWSGRPRGVLLDIGVHVIDLLCWWLGDTVEVISATADGHGGPEAQASAQLVAGAAEIDLRLSYLVKLENRFVIEGTRGRIRGSTADYRQLEIEENGRPWRVLRAAGSSSPVDAVSRLIANVLDAGEGHTPLLIEARSTLPALQAIDEIYAVAGVSLSRCYTDWLATPANPVLPAARDTVA